MDSEPPPCSLSLSPLHQWLASTRVLALAPASCAFDQAKTSRQLRARAPSVSAEDGDGAEPLATATVTAPLERDGDGAHAVAFLAVPIRDGQVTRATVRVASGGGMGNGSAVASVGVCVDALSADSDVLESSGRAASWFDGCAVVLFFVVWLFAASVVVVPF